MSAACIRQLQFNSDAIPILIKHVPSSSRQSSANLSGCTNDSCRLTRPLFYFCDSNKVISTYMHTYNLSCAYPISLKDALKAGFDRLNTGNTIVDAGSNDIVR